MQIGAQLYTVREHLKTLEDFDNSLGRVAAMGYPAVQVSGSCPYDPVWLRDALAKHNLVCPITHIDPQKIMDDPLQVVKDHQVFGCTHIGIGGMPGEMRGSLEGYEQFRKTFLPIAQVFRDNGAKLMYHNHWFEFDKLDGKDVIQRILEDFPEDSLDFTLDLGWASFADQDVVNLINTLKGRLSCVHLKDYLDLTEEYSFAFHVYMRPIFEGKLDYTAYINALKSAGTQYALVETDDCYGEDPFASLEASYRNVIARFPEMK